MAHRDLLVVGNYAHDEIITQRGETFSALGGATAYMSTVLEALGADYEVVSKVGRDFLYGSELTRPPIVDLSLPTTSFLDDFTSGRRVGTVTALCSPIRAADLTGSAKIAIGNGCAGEVLPETVARLREISQVVVCDLQSLVRVLGPGGVIELIPLSRTGHPIGSIDFLKGSEEEAAFVDLSGPGKQPVLIITRGDQGCEIVEGTRRTIVPGFPAEEIDASGAGDCFLAGFGFGLSEGLGVLEAARLANYCGSLAVQKTGIPQLTRADFSTILATLRR